MNYLDFYTCLECLYRILEKSNNIQTNIYRNLNTNGYKYVIILKLLQIQIKICIKGKSKWLFTEI